MIDHPIPDQAHERIRDQIGCILKKEFDNQANIHRKDYCRGVRFFAERLAPLNHNETPAVILSLWKAKYGNKESDYVDGTYHFVLDIIASVPAKGEKSADVLSGFLVQKIYGAIRYILEHSMYETLEFDRPFILHTEVSDMQVLKFDQEGRSESSGTAQAQAVFVVRCGEQTTPPAGKQIAGTDTVVKLEETELGYEYTYNTP